MIFVYFDGAIMPKNPGGIPTWGIAAFDMETVLNSHAASPIHVDNGLAEGEKTNNVAEYFGIIKAFEWIKTQERGVFHVRGDSQLIIRQVGGSYGCKARSIMDLYRRAIDLWASLKASGYVVILEWIPREENKWADDQSRLAYYKHMGISPPARKEKRCLPSG